jgi:hypothetical protein
VRNQNPSGEPVSGRIVFSFLSNLALKGLGATHLEAPLLVPAGSDPRVEVHDNFARPEFIRNAQVLSVDTDPPASPGTLVAVSGVEARDLRIDRVALAKPYPFIDSATLSPDVVGEGY